MGVAPIVREKNKRSKRTAGTVLSNGKSNNSLPKRAGLPGARALACCSNITWA